MRIRRCLTAAVQRLSRLLAALTPSPQMPFAFWALVHCLVSAIDDHRDVY